MQLLGGKFCIRLHQVVSSVEAPHSRLDSSSGPKHRSKRFLAQVRQCLGWGGHQHRNALSRGFKYTQTLGWVLGEHWYPSCAKHQGQRQVIVGGSNSQLYTEVVSSTLILRSFVSDVSRLTIFFRGFLRELRCKHSDVISPTTKSPGNGTLTPPVNSRSHL